MYTLKKKKVSITYRFNLLVLVFNKSTSLYSFPNELNELLSTYKSILPAICPNYRNVLL